MKKLILTGSLLSIVSGSFASASAPAKAAPKLVAPAPAPVKSVAPAMPGMPPKMPPAAHVQLELVKISQEFLAEFNQAEIAQLGQVVETTLNTALASKDFDQAFVKLLTAVQEMASVIGSNLSVCKEIQVKLNAAVNKASASFNKLVASGVVPAQTNEFYFIKIANAVLAGLKDGLKKVKPSKEVCATPVVAPSSENHIDTSTGKIYDNATNKHTGLQVAPGKKVMFDQKTPGGPAVPPAPAPVK